MVTGHLLLGCGLYYGVLTFNLAITFWIGESLLGLVGVMIYLPVTLLFVLRLLNRVPGAVDPRTSAARQFTLEN
jgi:putative membrane protein